MTRGISKMRVSWEVRSCMRAMSMPSLVMITEKVSTTGGEVGQGGAQAGHHLHQGVDGDHGPFLMAGARPRSGEDDELADQLLGPGHGVGKHVAQDHVDEQGDQPHHDRQVQGPFLEKVSPLSWKRRNRSQLPVKAAMNMNRPRC